MLASPNGPALFPAARTTNRSPKVWSKINSGGTRLSEQLSTVAFGCCDFVSDWRTLTGSNFQLAGLQGFAEASTPTLANLRELYASTDPVSTRFVLNLLQCAACTSDWRCDHCDYRQVASDRPQR